MPRTVKCPVCEDVIVVPPGAPSSVFGMTHMRCIAWILVKFACNVG
jgi:ribosomal protein S27E